MSFGYDLRIRARAQRDGLLARLSRKRCRELEPVEQLLQVSAVGWVDRGEEGLVIVGRLSPGLRDESENLLVGQVPCLRGSQVERSARAEAEPRGSSPASRELRCVPDRRRLTRS